eukprot:scaffold16700_cov119-Cylindrotheca_fusiformis.AAC.2
MSSQDNIPSIFCRIYGLTSAAGQKKNGSAGLVRITRMGFDTDIRLPVLIDGYSAPLSIKQANIRFYDGSQVAQSVAFHINHETGGGTPLGAATCTAGLARSKLSLNAVGAFISKFYNPQNEDFPIVVTLSDLNVARAMNRAAVGDSSVQLAEPVKELFQGIKDKLTESGRTNHNILFKFESQHVSEGRFEPKNEKLGPQRYQAAKAGTFQIYPCALKQHLDTHEVCYADPTSEKNVTIQHEMYIDCGMEETLVYPKHAAAMGETDRLSPSVLAVADPQAFWGALLWLEHFISSLEELGLPADLLEEWKELEGGKRKSREEFEKCMRTFGYDPASLKGPEEHWGVNKSKDVHVRVATDYSIAAFHATQTMITNQAPGAPSVSVEVLDDYYATDYFKYTTGSILFLQMIQKERKKTGSEVSAERSVMLFNQAMNVVGFRNDSKIASEQRKSCNNCGKRDRKRLLACARW